MLVYDNKSVNMYKKYKKTSVIKKTSQLDINTSAKYLIIVESPSKCKKIEEYLGTEYACIASNGHIRAAGGLKSIDVKNTFEPTYEIIEEKQEHVDKMRKIINRFSKDNVILATDDDREGEAIAWHICKVFDLSIETTPRILFHEITKTAILHAVKNPLYINMNLVHAQHARQVLDIIVGYKISPFLWKYLYNNKANSLSAGRCQTPALRLVYDNEKEKENGNGLETKYKTVGSFFSKNILFELNHEFDKSTEVLNFLEKTRTFNHKINIGLPKESIRSAPKPFHTSRLLQTASNVLHISPKDTMSICQKLYQNGLITYMRTESSQYSKTFLDIAKQFILNEWSDNKYLGDLDALEIKDATNPHEAIRVTNLETKHILNTEKDDKRMSAVYRMIWKNTVESCMADAKYNAIKVQISAPIEYHYAHTLEIPIFIGWHKVNEKTDNLVHLQNSPSAMHMYIQSIVQSPNPLPYNFIESTVVVRNKHQHYTEATLIQRLENLGIGRPSTFATIVETIQERGYVLRTDLEGIKTNCIEYKLEENAIKESTNERIFGNEKNKLVIQPVGIITIEFLLQNFQSMFSYGYTKQMEEQLDLVSYGEQPDWSTVCKNCYSQIKDLSKQMTSVTKQIFPLEEGYAFMFEKFGPTIKRTLDDGTFEYLSVKKDMNIDLDKLKKGEYSLEDLIEDTNRLLGTYNGEQIYLKRGKYGVYVEMGIGESPVRESVSTIKKPMNEITLADVEEHLKKLEEKETKEPAILRQLNNEMSVRKGKFGPYVFYKRLDMKKPHFLNIKKFNEGFFACEASTLIDWLNKTYNLK